MFTTVLGYLIVMVVREKDAVNDGEAKEER